MKKLQLIIVLLTTALIASACSTSKEIELANETYQTLVEEVKEIESSEESFDNMADSFNEVYKTALFATGKEKKEEAESSTIKSLALWEKIEEKYLVAPQEYKNTNDWVSVIENIGDYERKAEKLVKEGKLLEAHEELEMVRKLIKELRVENNIKNISSDMLVFHDIMEDVIEAEDKSEVQNKFPELIEMLDSLKSYNKERVEYAESLKKLEDITMEMQASVGEDFKILQSEIKSAFIAIYIQFG